jgi:hypothetical protein
MSLPNNWRTATKQTKVNTMKNNTKLIALTATVLVALGVGAFIASQPSDKEHAWAICQKSVRAQLNVPFTAKFMLLNEVADVTAPDSKDQFHLWSFSSTVWAQNGYGAYMSNRFNCVGDYSRIYSNE